MCINARGRVVGYTIGNDVSSRDIEGENPLYLPQAKIYDGACALGPAMLVSTEPLPPETPIRLRVTRAGSAVVDGRDDVRADAPTPRSSSSSCSARRAFPMGACC